jgi:hypothetical protein
MSERVRYPAGVPCWVDTLQPDPRAALDFYGALFEWEFDGPGPMRGDPPGEYFVAQIEGRDVAGIGSLPDLGAPAVPSWNTSVRVDSADDAAEHAKAAGASLLAGPLDALPAGRLAVLVDPVSAAFCLWEARARAGAQLVNEPRTWAMSSLHTTDPERAKEFYGSLFGWQPEPFGPPAAEMTLWRLPGYVGGEPQQPVPRDFWVDDANATAEQAAGLGGKVLMPPFDAPGFRSAVVADPQGAVFSISQLTAGPA